MNCYLWKSLLPLGLSLSLCVEGSLTQAFAQTTPAGIEIVVVEGEGATSSVRQRVSQDPVVRVEDDDHQPVAGAVVTFALPVSGASGEFANGSKTLTLVTEKNGVAAAHGLKTNDIPGKLQIYVTASYRGQRARVLINQTVEAPPGVKVPTKEHTASSGGKWKWILLGIAAGGGAGAAVYFKSHNSTAAPSPISISAGTIAFGSPR